MEINPPIANPNPTPPAETETAREREEKIVCKRKTHSQREKGMQNMGV